MARHHDRTFEDREVILDGDTFVGCSFHRCILVFQGTAPVEFGPCYLGDDVQWRLDGAALLTAQFLRMLYLTGDEGLKQTVDGLIEQLRGRKP